MQKDKQTTYILSCEAIKQGSDFDQRYEIQVAVCLKDHQKLDEQISKLLKEAGYLFMYSGEAKPIIQYLEEAEFYDQKAIELSQQVDLQRPIAYSVIKLISDESQAKTAADYLHIEHIENIEPLGRQIGILEKKTVPDSIRGILFDKEIALHTQDQQSELFRATAPSQVQETLKTYVVIDASKIEVFDGSHFLDKLPRKSLYTGEASRLYERLAPYIIELEEKHDFTRRLFTQAENEKQQPWFFYQQSAGIYIRSTLSLEELWRHFRKLTRIWNPRTETWLQFRFFEPYWLEDMLQCMTPAELSKFWGTAIDQFILVKPLQKRTSVVNVKAELASVKAGKFEMTERYEEKLQQCKDNRFIQSVQSWCIENLADYCPVHTDSVTGFVAEKVQLAFTCELKLEQAILYFVASYWLMEAQDKNWAASYYKQLCESNDGQLIRTEKLFDQALALKGLN